MKQAAKSLDFERAALLRDRIIELRREFEFADFARNIKGK
jgi:excinuclease UvrABC helicase subunit UvrB